MFLKKSKRIAKKTFLIIFFITTINCFFLNSSFANTVSIGNVNAKAFNDILDRWENRKITLSANFSDLRGSIAIYYEMSLKSYGIKYSFYLDDQNKLKPQKYLNNLLKVLNKSIEWSNTAKKNKVNVKKEIPSEKFCALTYNGSNVECKAIFISTNQGANTFLLLYVREIENLSYGSDSELFYIDLVNQKSFKDILENKIYEKVNYLVEQEKKNEGLFN
jgi:hypothetical protein